MKPVVNLLAFSAGAFVVLTAANVAANSVYTHSKIGVDKKALAISLGVGLAVTFAMMKVSKKI